MYPHELLNRLEGVVKVSGSGQYLAKCPAHQDKSPSLSVKIEHDGKVLIHCFACCSPIDVLDSVGMELSDLFPEPLEIKHDPKARAEKERVESKVFKAKARLAITKQKVNEGYKPTPDELSKARAAFDYLKRVGETI